LFPLAGQAKDVYSIRHLSEHELLQTYTDLLVDACHHADQFWKASAFDADAGYWGDGVSDGNQGIRAIGEMVFTCGVLLKYSDAPNAADRAAWLSKATAALRFACATHKTGREKCPDGKSWGNSWQSAMWTGTLGFGAWLIWDKLDAPLQQAVERVVAAEADRFLAGRPPQGTDNDTKAEENGWNLICLSLAPNMFPAHPHAAAWNEKAIEYMINTLSAPQDRQDATVVDGRPVREWFSGANLFPDFTLENHGFFHPAYVACSSYFLTQAALHFVYAHRPIPQAATHHLRDVWHMFRTILLPQGEPAYPQGMDWELHGITVINLFASLAGYQHDAVAAGSERNCLQYMRAWQQMENGNLAVPGSRLGFTRHAICAEQAAYGFLAHQLFGPPAQEPSAQEAAPELCGVHTFDSVGLVTHRTRNKLVTFSWKNRVGGLLIPIGAGHEGQPYFTVPIPNGLVGSFDLTSADDRKISVVEHAWHETANGFETTGTLLTNHGRLRQQVKVTSLGERAVVYQDRVTALADVSVAAERGVPVGVENDKVTGGFLTVFHPAGKSVFEFNKSQKPTGIAGSWANVDGRLGVVVIAGSGMEYVPATGYHPGMAVGIDVLYASSSDQPKSVKAGEEVTRRVVLFLVEMDAEKTAALAQSLSVTNESGVRVLRLMLPEGPEAQVPLL
jgi:hypothetical protein